MNPIPKQSAGDGIDTANITLRDFFAAAALQGQLAAMSNQDKQTLRELGAHGVNLSDLAAASSYLYADAMLKIRELSTEQIVQNDWHGGAMHSTESDVTKDRWFDPILRRFS